MKEHECRRSGYEGENIADWDGIFCFEGENKRTRVWMVLAASQNRTLELLLSIPSSPPHSHPGFPTRRRPSPVVPGAGPSSSPALYAPFLSAPYFPAPPYRPGPSPPRTHPTRRRPPLLTAGWSIRLPSTTLELPSTSPSTARRSQVAAFPARLSCIPSGSIHLRPPHISTVTSASRPPTVCTPRPRVVGSILAHGVSRCVNVCSVGRQTQKE
jgi:hypothetical protein